MRIVNFSFLVKQFSYENFAFSLTIFIKRDIPLLYTLFKKKKKHCDFLKLDFITYFKDLKILL